MIGPSGGGKSTWAKENCNPKNEVILSSDWFREAVTRNFFDLSQQPRVFTAMHKVARAYLDAGINVILDATYLKQKDRIQTLETLQMNWDIYPDADIMYVICNQPMKDKLKPERLDWRPECLVKKHEKQFLDGLETLKQEIEIFTNIGVIDDDNYLDM